MKIINKLILSIVVILTIFNLTEVYAENYSASNFVVGDYIPNMYIKKLKANGTGQYKQGRIINKIDDNSFVYCLQPFVEIDSSQTYQVATSDYATILQMTEEQWSRVRLLAYYGYQYGNHTDSKWYYITQVLIWRTVDPTANIFFTNTLNGTRNDNLYSSEIAEIEGLVANHLIKPSFNETNFNIMLGESVILTDSNNVLNHYKITSTTNVTAEILNNTLMINATNVGNGSIILQKTDIKYNIPPLVYYSPYSQDAMTVGYFDPVPAKLSLNVEGGQIRITKVDNETNQTVGQGNATLVGAKYEVLNSNNEVVSVLTIGEDSTAITDYLSNGQYTIHEILESNGYYLDNNIYTVNITSSGIFDITVKEQVIKGKIKIVKIDSENKLPISIAGFKFKIKDKNTNQYICQTIDEEVCIFETNEDGIAITPFTLFEGNYTIEEVESASGYLLSEKKIDLSINKNTEFIEDSIYGPLIEVYFENESPKGEIVINKIGEEIVLEDNSYSYQEVELDGVVYSLYAQEDIFTANGELVYNKDDLIATYKTENGYLKISNLYLGKYYIQEVSTVNEHILDSKKYEINLEYQNQSTPVVSISLSLKNYLPKADLEFTKTDLVDGSPIPNVKIEIYTENDELIYNGITDKNGVVILKDLFVGKFYIVETETVEGYVLSSEKVYFQIKENGEIVKANMTNKKITSKVGIHKVDEDDNPIKGVTIGVYDLENNLIYFGVTDENGDIEFAVEYGSYYFQEISTLDQFELSNEKIYFDVTEDGKYIQKILVNELKEIEIPNTSSNSYFIPISVLILGMGIILFIISNKKNKKV